MRFDDSLATVLAADTQSAFGAQSAWRQLVDLLARGRVGDMNAALVRLGELRAQVPLEVRAAGSRAVAGAQPPAELVALLAGDEAAVAGPVLRAAQLSASEWLTLLPSLGPRARAVLRHRRDLQAEVVRGLESFGAADFVLGHDGPEPLVEPEAEPPAAPLDATPFVAVGEAARAIPLVAEALKRQAEPGQPSEIADLVARIDAYQRTRTAPPPVDDAVTTVADRFHFGTDSAGVIRWVDGIARGPLIGTSLALAGTQGAVQLDATICEALRRRCAFRCARLEIGGRSAAAGEWRIAGEPSFDAATGRFIGMTCVARRVQPVEAALSASPSDQLRQLVHELRTPATAIAGFAELIDHQLLGPVPPHYRERAALIGREAAALIGAIEDLDTAARIEGGALELRPGQVDLAELVRHAAAELQPLANERGATLTLDLSPARAAADDRAAQRLVTRLLATLLAAAAPGERLRAQVVAKTRSARLAVTRPRALAVSEGDALLSIDADASGAAGPLLGVGFGLRLARNLAAELGGRLQVEEARLTLRLPLAQAPEVEQAAAQ